MSDSVGALKVYTLSEMIEAICRRIDHLQGRVSGRSAHADNDVGALEAAVKTLRQIMEQDL